MPDSDPHVDVEVTYAEPQRAITKALRLRAPATIADALHQVAEDAAFAGVDVANLPVGIFGRLAERSQPLETGDRVEIYRPLAADPKLARRARVREARIAGRRRR